MDVRFVRPFRGTPEYDCVADFTSEENRLPPYTVDIRGPWVFVHLGAPRRPLAEADYLAPFPQPIADSGRETLIQQLLARYLSTNMTD